MTSNDLDRLVKRFIEIGLQQDEADLYFKASRYSKLYREKVKLVDTLRQMSGDGRRVLEPLLDHPNGRVRLNAAVATLTIFPEAARSRIELLRADMIQPYAADAGSLLLMLDDGRYVPD